MWLSGSVTIERQQWQEVSGRKYLPDMAKLADAPDLGSGGAIHVGSTPIIRTFFSELISKMVDE